MMPKKRNNQNSSCPEGYLPAGIVIPLHLTRRQEKYASRAVGIARAVYNTMVATHQLARAHGHGAWPSPMEMEKLFNEFKHEPAFGMTFTTEVSKFVAQGACRNFRDAYNRWLDPGLKARKPVFHKKKATGAGSFLAASGVARIHYDGHRPSNFPAWAQSSSSGNSPQASPTKPPYANTWENGNWPSPTGSRHKTPRSKPTKQAPTSSASSPWPWIPN